MRRRAFITLLSGAATWPLVARAQQPTRHIGMLIGYAENDPEIQARLAAFRQALEGNGWKVGGNLRIDYRFAPASPDQAQVYAKELVALRPDVLVGNSTPSTAALLQETGAIPVVFVGVSDPVGSHFVASIARPGGSATGFTKRFRNMRALFPMYDNPFQAVVLQRSGIATLAQLDKKRIGVGPRSGNGATYAPGIFKIVGISAELSYGSYNTIASELLDGRIDALLTLLGAPVPAIEDVDAKEPVKFLNLSPEQMDAIRKTMPVFGPAKIAAGTYRLLDKDYVTVGVPNFVIGRADLPDDLVYQLVKATFENQPRLVKATSAASDTLPQNVVKNSFLPFHPGAVRYYREIGVKIPDALVPTN